MNNQIPQESLNFPETLPFDKEEYLRRHALVREEMSRRGIDVLFITSPANIFYLTGYEACWYPWRLPLGVVIAREPDALVFLDWTRHDDYVLRKALYGDTVFFEYHDMLETTVEAFRRYGWTNRRVGIEWYSPNPSGPIIHSVADGLQKTGAAITSGDWAVDKIRLYKSAAEVEKIRRAAAIADSAFKQLQNEMKPGMTQIEVSALLTSLLIAEGSEYAATNPLVHSGPDAWCDIHAFPSDRKLEAGDVVSVDCCAVVDRYHANLGRTFALGDASPRAREILDLAAGSLQELQQHAVTGEGPETAIAAAGDYVRARIPEEQIWWVGGYSLGIGFPPSWVGHTYLANDGLEKCTLEPGYVSNYENVFLDREEGFSAQSIDTVLMTDKGLEVLSGLPRTLLQVDI